MGRRDSAFAIIRRRDQILLVKSGNRWQLPGGRMKRREDPWEGALREVKEETGLQARILGLTGIYRRGDGSLAFVFAARVAWDDRVRGPRHEISKQRWVPFLRALERLSKGARARLADALRRPALFRSRGPAKFLPAPAGYLGPLALHLSVG